MVSSNFAAVIKLCTWNRHLAFPALAFPPAGPSIAVSAGKAHNNRMKKTTHYTGHRWTTEEMRTLMQMWANDEELKVIAEKLEVTTASILHTVNRLRHSGIPLKRRTRGHKAGRQYQLWTQGEVEYLVRRREEKATCEEIAVDLGRSWSAVNAMINKLRQEQVPIAMRGNGVRRLWNADLLKGVALQLPEIKKVEFGS